MKTINVTFEDEEFELLNNAKSNDSWHDFILTLVTTRKKSKLHNKEDD